MTCLYLSSLIFIWQALPGYQLHFQTHKILNTSTLLSYNSVYRLLYCMHLTPPGSSQHTSCSFLLSSCRTSSVCLLKLETCFQTVENNSAEGRLIKKVKNCSWCQDTSRFSITSARRRRRVHNSSATTIETAFIATQTADFAHFLPCSDTRSASCVSAERICVADAYTGESRYIQRVKV